MRASILLPLVSLTALLASCSNPTAIRPRPQANAAPSASRANSRGVLYPNTRKYRDTGARPGVGQSGTAVVAMRTLLDAAGTTDVELTTGSFDDPTAATTGTLSMVQVKSQANGTAFTSNQTNLTSSTGSFPYGGIAHGTPVLAQAVVRGMDGARSNVVNVTDNVHFRPDMSADLIDGPDAGPIGGAINFFGLIGERLGDLGARASCAFYVDGQPVDRADNIWIDAYGEIGCLFTHVFTTTGIHKVELRVENVQPGDYDLSNNSLTKSIRIEEPNGFAAYSLQGWDVFEDSKYRNLSLWDGILYDQTTSTTGRWQSASMGGLIHRTLEFPIRIHGEYATNGATFDVTDETYDSAPFVDWQPGYCDGRAAIPGSTSTYVCVYTGGYLAGYTFVQYDWFGANILYHSDTYSRVWGDDTSEPSYEAAEWTQIAPMLTYGPELTGTLTVYGAGDPLPAASATSTVPLAPLVTNEDYVHPSCSSTPVPLTCWESHIRQTGRIGYTAFGSWPSYTP